MVRKGLLGVGALLAFTATMMVGAPSANADVKLAIGTPAAKLSPWGKVFKVWGSAVAQKTKDAVSLEFFYNSTKGTEATMVDKMKAGELDGAAVTSIGLGKLDKRLLTIGMPGLAHDWKTVDKMRAAVADDYNAIFKEKGVVLITPGDVGYAHFLTTGFKVHQPTDLADHSPWIYSEDLIQKAVYGEIKGVKPVPDELMAVGNDLGSKIDSMAVSSLAAEMLQWNSKFNYGIDEVEGVVVGAVVMSSKSLDNLPADQRAVVVDTGAAMGSSAAGLKEKIRNEDAAAWDRFKTRSGVEIYKPTNEDRAAWDKVFTEARAKLKKNPALGAELITKIENAAK